MAVHASLYARVEGQLDASLLQAVVPALVAAGSELSRPARVHPLAGGPKVQALTLLLLRLVQVRA